MAELLRQAGSSSVDTSGDPKPSYHDDVVRLESLKFL